MTLLEKFDAVKLSDEDQIPAADKEWCEQEQKNFKKVLTQLTEKQEYFKKKAAVEDHFDECHFLSGMFAGTYWKDRREWKSSSWKDKNYYDLFRYSSAYQVKECSKLKTKLKEEFVKNVALYFVEKYNLDIPDYHNAYGEKLDERCDYKVILGLIKESLGGFLDFRGGAIEKAIEDIQSELRYSTAILTGNILEFPRFAYGRGNDKYPEVSEYRNGGSFAALDKAISIFETEEVKDNYALMYLSGKSAGNWDTPLNGEKIEAFKFWKSGKFQLKFKEAAYATAFVSRFNLKIS